MTIHESLSSFEKHFGKIEDTRDNRGLLHPLNEILQISVLAVICGAGEFTEMEEFGIAKERFLDKFIQVVDTIMKISKSEYFF
jgi:hypothetical protein